MKVLLVLAAAVLTACGQRVDTTWTTDTGIVAASTASANTTTCMDTRGAKLLVLDHEVTRGGASITALETKCAEYRSPTCGDTIAKLIPSCTGASCAQFKPSWPLSATEGWPLRWDVSGYDFVKCTFTATGGHASDTLTVKAFQVRE